MDFSYLRGMRVCVTGATGFVGRHLVPRLVEAGAEVSCIVRASSDTRGLPQEARIIQADLCSGSGLAGALEGQDALVHMAALLFGTGWQDYLQSNTRAAETLARAAAEVSSLRRVVLVSSLSATGPSDRSPGVRDNADCAPVSAYGWSKYVSEQIFSRRLGDRLVTLRPPIIYGSGDRGLLPCFRAAQQGLLVTPGCFRPFPVSAVHVHDMAQAVMCALSEKARGVYHINDGHEYTMRDFDRAMARAVGKKGIVLGLPLWFMCVTAFFSTLWAKLRPNRRAPSWNMDKFREARCAGWLCDSSRITEELGYKPAVSLHDGMAEAVSGYRSQGMLQ